MNIKKYLEKKWITDSYDIQKIEDIFESNNELKDLLKTHNYITTLLYFTIFSFVLIILLLIAGLIILSFTWVSIFFDYLTGTVILIIVIAIFCISGGVLLYSAIALVVDQNVDMLAHIGWWEANDKDLEIAIELYNQTNRDKIIMSDTENNSFVLEKYWLIINWVKVINKDYTDEEKETIMYKKYIIFNIKSEKNEDIFKNSEFLESRFSSNKMLDNFQEKTGLYYSVSWNNQEVNIKVNIWKISWKFFRYQKILDFYILITEISKLARKI